MYTVVFLVFVVSFLRRRKSLNVDGFPMRPKSAIVLTNKTHPSIASSASLMFPSAMALVAFGCVLAKRYGMC